MGGMVRRTRLLAGACFIFACGGSTDTFTPPAGAGGGGGNSTIASSVVGSTVASAASGPGGAGGASSTSTGGGSDELCLDIAVIAEGGSPSNFGGGAPTGPCEVDLTGLLSNVDGDTLYVELQFFDAPDVVLERVQGVGDCLQNAAGYYLESEVFKLCPETCVATSHAVFEKLIITAECAD